GAQRGAARLLVAREGPGCFRRAAADEPRGRAGADGGLGAHARGAVECTVRQHRGDVELPRGVAAAGCRATLQHGERRERWLIRSSTRSSSTPTGVTTRWPA